LLDALAAYVLVELATLRTVPLGALVLVAAIGPVVAVAGTVAIRWVAETWTTVEAAVPLMVIVFPRAIGPAGFKLLTVGLAS
jgi:hypothetical protein